MSHRNLFRWHGIVITLMAGALAAGCSSDKKMTTESKEPARESDVQAEEPADESEKAAREVDAKADEIFQQMCKKLEGSAAFSFRIRATMDGEVEMGHLAQFNRVSNVTFARPDRLHVEMDSDEGAWTLWYSGKEVTVLDRVANAFSKEEAPDRVDEMLDYMVDEYDLVMPMADLLTGNLYESMLSNVEAGSYLGVHSVGDVPCHHMLFLQENIDWQIWIDAGAEALPRKLVITYTQEADQPQYVAMMDNWNLAPEVSKETFVFTAPAEATSVSMADLLSEESQEEGE